MSVLVAGVWVYLGEGPRRPLLNAALRGDVDELLGAIGRPTLRPEGIVIHHTATPDQLGGRPVTAAVIDRLHQARGFSTNFGGREYHIGYHYVILPDGSIESGRPERSLGAHTGDAGTNRRLLGIAVVGDFDPQSNPLAAQRRLEPTADQMRSLSLLVTRLSATYSLRADSIVTHQHLDCDTRCPGERLTAQLSLVTHLSAVCQ